MDSKVKWTFPGSCVLCAEYVFMRQVYHWLVGRPRMLGLAWYGHAGMAVSCMTLTVHTLRLAVTLCSTLCLFGEFSSCARACSVACACKLAAAGE